jgi:Domain of unknown function (DUF1877)
MRFILALIACLCLSLPCPAHASMLFRAIMVAPGQVPALKGNDTALEQLIDNPGKDDLVLQKEWHGIHYLLTGDPWSAAGPYGQVILGGVEIGADLGYGPARLLTPPEVKAIAAQLKNMPVEKLRERYNAAAMDRAKIYPGGWVQEGDEARDWVFDAYGKLVDFYARAAAQGKAVILVVV